MNTPANMQKVSFYNLQDYKIAGLLCTPSSLGNLSGSIVVVCHGFTGSKEGGGKALEMAEAINRQGWSVFLFDFAGCGESEGFFEDLTLTRQINDLHCAVNWLLKKGFTKIVTLGRSFGGTTAICHAARTKIVAGVCAWSTPAKLDKLFGDLFPKKKGQSVLVRNKKSFYLKQGFFEDLKKHDVAGDAALISPRPFLLIHGTDDQLVLPENAEIIYHAAGNPKKIVWIENGDHQFSLHYKQVWQAFLDWLAFAF